MSRVLKVCSTASLAKMQANDIPIEENSSSQFCNDILDHAPFVIVQKDQLTRHMCGQSTRNHHETKAKVPFAAKQ